MRYKVREVGRSDRLCHFWSKPGFQIPSIEVASQKTTGAFFEPFDSRSAGGFHGQPRESREELGC